MTKVSLKTNDSNSSLLKEPRTMKLFSTALSDFVETLDKKSDGTRYYHSTGFAAFDRQLSGGLLFGNLIVLASRPAMGKSGLAFQIAENVARGNISVIYYSLEMSINELVERALSRHSNVALHKLKSGKLESRDWKSITSALDKLKGLPLIIDEAGLQTPQSIWHKTTHVSTSVAKRGLPPLGLVVVDYLQLIAGRGQNRTLEVSEITRSLKTLAKELGIPVLALSQLNRGVENRPDKRPMLADLRESGGIEQDADSVSFIYRDDYYNPESPNKGIAEIITAKNRHGSTGAVQLAFVADRVMFGDLAHV